MLRKLRYRLIRVLAGQDTIVIGMSFVDVTLHGSERPAFVADCMFRGSDTAVVTA